MYSDPVLSWAVVPYLIAALALAGTAGGAYGAGAIGAPLVYGAVCLAALIAAVGIVRWDIREHGR
jgi:hypothetical protein